MPHVTSAATGAAGPGAAFAGCGDCPSMRIGVSRVRSSTRFTTGLARRIKQLAPAAFADRWVSNKPRIPAELKKVVASRSSRIAWYPRRSSSATALASSSPVSASRRPVQTSTTTPSCSTRSMLRSMVQSTAGRNWPRQAPASITGNAAPPGTSPAAAMSRISWEIFIEQYFGPHMLQKWALLKVSCGRVSS